MGTAPETAAGPALLEKAAYSWYKGWCAGLLGYIAPDLLIVPEEAEVISGVGALDGSVSGQEIVDTAMKYIGVPYVWAGTSPNGFDCSGFVYYVFSENGYGTYRTAESLMLNGEAVNRDELLPGDVLGFVNSGGGYIGHCGIYIGDGQFIHASSGDGAVTIDDLDTGYYANCFYAARRIAA